MSSDQEFKESSKVIPGGVNSPVRAYNSVGGTPFFADRAQGAYLWDTEGKRYIDYVQSWGASILGHAHPKIVEAIQTAAKRGTSFGVPTVAETRLAELIADRVPGVEQVRLVNSGTEATMTALRLARGLTERPKILKFSGCYHGHSDGLLVAGGSGLATLGTPSSAGVNPNVAADTLICEFNDFAGSKQLVEEHSSKLAAIIVEPIAANMGVIPPADGFLEHLRQLANSTGAQLIFDEVITGFRVGPGGAAELFGVQPDLYTWGKIIGGGMPLAALGGSTKTMSALSPQGPVYQAGTLSGNPLATAAGIVALEQLDAEVYERITDLSEKLVSGWREQFAEHGITTQLTRIETISGLFFAESSVEDFTGAGQADHKLYGRFFRGLEQRGIHLAPSGYEAIFVSAAHSEADIEETLAASAETLEGLGE